MSHPSPPDRSLETLAVLRRCRGLQGLDKAAVQAMADEVEIVRYPRGHLFFRDQPGEDASALRVIVQGQLLWHPRARVDHSGAPTLGRGALFGLASVAVWAREHGTSEGWDDDHNPGAVAEAQEALWVFELPCDSYHRVFSSLEGRALLERLLGLHAASAHWARVATALHHTPEFSRSSPRNVARLAQCGVLQTWAQGEPHRCSGDDEMAIFYVVSGAVSVRGEGGHEVTVIADDLSGHTGIFAWRRPGRVLTSVGARPAKVVRIGARELALTLNTTPGMTRVLGPSSLGTQPHSGPSSAHPLVVAGEVTLVVADPGVSRDPLPLGGLVELLAAQMRSGLGDAVWVLRVVASDHPVPDQTDPLSPPGVLRIDRGDEVERQLHDGLAALMASWGLLFDQILLDTSSFDPTGVHNLAMMRAMASQRFCAQVAYLISDPTQWDDAPEAVGIVAGVNVLPTALLGPVRPHERKRRDSLRRRLHAAGQWAGLPRAFPVPWPLDAVRVRLSPTVMRALDEADPTTELAALGLPATELAGAEAALGRWARAVTWRRVGVAIGGAGAQSYVAVPFLQQIMERGVPVDVIAGSSTGAFIGAFYSVMGDRGLDEVVRRWYGFSLGVMASWWADNTPFELWLTKTLEYLDLNDFEVPTVAVAARAATGDTVYLTSSLAGQACMASGSLPPMTPTYIGNQRLLDGALTTDVPTAILASAGAELIVGIQPVPRVTPDPMVPDSVVVPPPLKLLMKVNPLLRGYDYIRGYMMLVRQAARSEDDNADVVYEATTRDSNAGTFWQGRRIIREAAASPSLRIAVEETVAEWAKIRAAPAGRITLEPATGRIVLGDDARVTFVGGALTLRGESTVRCLARFLIHHPTLDLIVGLGGPEAPAHAEALRAVFDDEAGLGPRLVVQPVEASSADDAPPVLRLVARAAPTRP